MKITHICVAILAIVQQESAAQSAIHRRTPEYEFVLSDDKIKNLTEGLRKLKLGDSIDKVNYALGKPDEEYTRYRINLFRGGVPSFKFLGYHIKTVKIGTGNLHDEAVLLYFDREGKLIKIYCPPSTCQPKRNDSGSNAGVAPALNKYFHFKLPPEKRAKLEEEIEKIRIGDSLPAVKSILGPPDNEYTVYKPRLIGRSVFLNRTLNYYVHIVGDEPGNVRDQSYALFFDKTGKLVNILKPSQGLTVAPQPPSVGGQDRPRPRR